MNNRNRLTTYIIVGLVLGIAAGYIAHINLADPAGFADTLSLVTTLFLRLIKMIIAPLVFATLVGGIAHMGSGAEARPHLRQGHGLVRQRLVRLAAARPGHGQPAAAGRQFLPATAAGHGAIDRHRRSRPSRSKEFLTHLIPTSIVDAMAKNEILQIVVFAVFFGTGAAALGRARQADARR